MPIIKQWWFPYARISEHLGNLPRERFLNPWAVVNPFAWSLCESMHVMVSYGESEGGWQAETSAPR